MTLQNGNMKTIRLPTGMQTGMMHDRRRAEMLIMELDAFKDLVEKDKHGNQRFALKDEVRKKVRRLCAIEVVGQVSEIRPFNHVMKR